jgi:hypothetical protein
MTTRSPWLAAKIAARMKAKASPARKRRAKKARAKKSEPRVRVIRLGRALKLDYIHARNGRAYTHKFSRGVAVTYTRDGKYLVIGPVSAKTFIEG